MTPEARWQRAMISALRLDSLFNSAQMQILVPSTAARLKPTPVEIEHAVARIRVWREYLPAPCVAAMIKDGWQWST